MKKTVRTLILFFLSFLTLSAGEMKTVKVLVVGNSFSKSLLTYLPKIVKAEGKYELILANLYIGGCTLERHVKELEKAEKDPEYRPYLTNYGKQRKVNLPEMIGKEKWDIVSIQQGSQDSWKKASYQPHADELIAYIQKYAPQAEIVIHETWSYRSDSKRFIQWKINQDSMYESLRKCYFDLAAEKHFRIIPVGDAVQFYRKNAPVAFKAPSVQELEKLQNSDFPGTQEGDAVGNFVWLKPKKGQTAETLGADSHHLNAWGKYMQACIWYGFLFDESPETIKKYQPEFKYEWMSPLCRKAAAQALNGVCVFNKMCQNRFDTRKKRTINKHEPKTGVFYVGNFL